MSRRWESRRVRSGLVLSVVALSVCALPGGSARAAAAAAPAARPALSSPGHSPVPVFSSLYGVSCPRVSYCVAVGAYNANDVISVLTELWNGSTWSVIPTPRPPHATSSALNAISCSSVSRCLAVGAYTDATHANWAFSEVWDGSAWTVAGVPIPAGASSSALNGVSCAGASYCFAVGSYANSRSIPRALIESWNGSSWSIAPSPHPFGSARSSLVAVSCASEAACMATGAEAADGTPLAEFWNGTSWSIVDSPNPVGGQAGVLAGISCPHPTRCLAVGSYTDSDFIEQDLAASWDGSRWSIVASPTPPGSQQSNLYGISCASASQCVAVGHSYSGTAAAHDGTLAESWNGVHWSIVASPSPSTTSSLDAISCAATGPCLAVGLFFNSSGAYQTLAEFWNGTSLSIVNQDAALAGVTCVDDSHCIAVGSYLDRHSVSKTLVEAWDGDAWRTVPSPDPLRTKGSYLAAISCVTADRCVAVGYDYRLDNSRASLIESWNGDQWSIMPSPNPAGAAYSVLYGISCTSASACLAVGSAASFALAEKWDGSRWSLVPAANRSSAAYSELTGISCTDAVHCLGVGYETDTHFHADVTLAEQWNGAAWTLVPSAAPGKNSFQSSILHGMSCSTAGGCLAVGEHERTSGTFAAFTERWTGTRWAVLDTPSPSGSGYTALSAISCVSTGRCSAVGTYFDHSGSFVPLSETWTGTTWRILSNTPSSTRPSGISYLLAVSCTESFTCLSTGSSGDPANLDILTRVRHGSP
jgi:hypothetical protein